MTDENRRHAIALELERADGALRAAKALRDLALYNDALTRLYYAMFHTVTALLLTHGVEPRRHRGLPHLLGQHCSDLLSATDIAVVAQTATYRELADYERAWTATSDFFAKSFAEVEPLIVRVREDLAAKGWASPKP